MGSPLVRFEGGPSSGCASTVVDSSTDGAELVVDSFSSGPSLVVESFSSVSIVVVDSFSSSSSPWGEGFGRVPVDCSGGACLDPLGCVAVLSRVPSAASVAATGGREGFGSQLKPSMFNAAEEEKGRSWTIR